MRKHDRCEARESGDAWLAAVAIVLTTAGGCALIAGPVAEKIASGVEKYCDEPLGYREIYRNTVNAQLTHTGHVVHVHCAGDPVAQP